MRFSILIHFLKVNCTLWRRPGSSSTDLAATLPRLHAWDAQPLVWAHSGTMVTSVQLFWIVLMLTLQNQEVDSQRYGIQEIIYHPVHHQVHGLGYQVQIETRLLI